MSTRIALIDDDSTEAMILEGMLEHAPGDFSLSHFSSLDAFANAEGAAAFDVVFLDRRIPPFERFEDSLAALEQSAVDAPVILISAHADGPADYAGRLRLVGPVSKSDLLDPDSVARVVNSAQNAPE